MFWYYFKTVKYINFTLPWRMMAAATQTYNQQREMKEHNTQH